MLYLLQITSIIVLYLQQITSMYADDEAGGVANSFKNMMEADPDFGKAHKQIMHWMLLQL